MTRLVVDPASYDVVLATEPSPEAIATFLHADEWTSIVPHGALIDGTLERQDGWRLLTIEAELPFDVVGFFRRFADALADAGIPILPFASYRYDHVLVPEARSDEARRVIQSVIDGRR